jgi:thiosulfate/3-mercaptopyruvate sulfurtransferase
LEHLGDPQVQLLDNRTPEEYSGRERYARRGGHIPGARLLPYDVTVNPDGTFKSPEEIRALHEAIGLDPERIVVNYCQTATRSAHAYFAQRLAGFRDPKVYEGSWAEWGEEERFPVER